MHPFLRSRSSLAVYLALWTVLGFLLMVLIAQAADLLWNEALILAAPLSLLYAFACLTPWYMCRALPLETTGAWRLGINHVGAAVLACAMWIGLARLLGEPLTLGERLDPAIPHLVAVGLLLYILSV